MQQLRTGDGLRSEAPEVPGRRRLHAQQGSAESTQRSRHKPAGWADAKERAGFMLMPDSGASTVMYSATRAPANHPVKRARRGMFETRRITAIRIAEMMNSAMNAPAGPRKPGTVAA